MPRASFLPRRFRSEPASSGWLHLPSRSTHDVAVKPAPYLPIYEDLLAPLREEEFTLLELGIWTGESLIMWRDCLPAATIVGVDLNPPDLDLGPRVHLVQGDQTDADLMRRLREQYAPEGFDVVIDDASHLGITTAQSLQALFTDHVRPGGLYCIEDWGTGYLPDWHDGCVVSETVGTATLDASPDVMDIEAGSPVRMPSHDIGMVGLMKRLLDHVAAAATLPYASPHKVESPLPIASMTVHDGIVSLRRR